MADNVERELRLVCVCGQRMRVLAPMYGKRARCVSCRQKIQIPRKEELPDGVEIIDLSEHTEFLLKSSRDQEKREVGQSPEEVILGEEGAEEEERTITPDRFPMEVLEPLRAVVSLEYRIRHKLSVFEKGSVDVSKSRYDERQLRRYLAEIQEVRETLNRLLEERLTETEAELKLIQEKLFAFGVSGKAGELELDEYLERVEKLRIRRDTLEKRRVNLKAWLKVRSPYEAGGYIRLPLDHVPDVSGRIHFRHEPEENVPLLNWWIRYLGDALTQREFADRKLRETDRLEAEGLGDVVELGHRRADAQGEYDRAEASVNFCRMRLEQLERDLRGDLDVLGAQLSVLRNRMSIGEISKSQFQMLSKRRARLSAELLNKLELIRRVLQCKTAQEVLRTIEGRGSFQEKSQRLVLSTANIVLWLGSSLILIGLFLPFLGQSVSAIEAIQTFRYESPQIYWLFLLPLFGSLGVFAAGFSSSKKVRGWVTLCVSGILTVGIAIFWQICSTHPGLIGEIFCETKGWFLRPGFIVSVLGLILLWVVGIQHFRGEGLKAWIGVLGVGFVVVLFSVVVATDFLGLLKPSLELENGAVSVSSDDQSGKYIVSFSLKNRGRKLLVLDPRPSYLRNGYDFSLEGQDSNQQWIELGNPEYLTIDGNEVNLLAGRIKHLIIPSGATAMFKYILSPGKYRLVVDGAGIATEFELPAPPPSATDSQLLPVELKDAQRLTDDRSETSDTKEGSQTPSEQVLERSQDVEEVFEVETPRIEVEWKGIVRSEGRMPLFQFVLYYPSGQVRTRLVPLMGELNEEWYVAEYNKEEQTVVLSDGKNLVILRLGNREKLAKE